MIPDDHDRLVRIEEKIDRLLEADQDKETRLRQLEASQNQGRGGLRVAAGLGGVAGAAAGWLLRRLL